MSSQKSAYQRIIIEEVSPQINGGRYPIKRVVGENVVVRVNVFIDGHEEVLATLLFRAEDEKEWHEVRMRPLGNDRWIGSFPIQEMKKYFYTVRGNLNSFNSWRKDTMKKIEAGQEVGVEMQMGVQLVEDAQKECAQTETGKFLNGLLQDLKDTQKTKDASAVLLGEEVYEKMLEAIDPKEGVVFDRILQVNVDRKKARFSSWYEFFPRSWAKTPGKHGTFKECEKILPEIARMGFDVVYLPPIHPIGMTHRKGKNNSTTCTKSDPGCPWAIGSKEGGHKAVNPSLGTLEEFDAFVRKAEELGMEVALDYALQCSPDHPYVKKHPEWFKWRPDGTVQYAENPPKKYEDVLPINFETEDRENLWQELKSIVVFWIGHGVKIFRVDNPHTKPFMFWDWLIAEIQDEYPDVIFLAEAFTRPNVMYRLAKGGFTQSYTYFTWRNTKWEFMNYMTELAQTQVAEFFRPNFWPNTPDILPEHLRYGGRPAFIMRAVLAGTLSSNFGIYGPAFELCETAAIENKEEYVNSEKYEIKKWNWDQPGNLKDFLSLLNKIRKENEALQITRNIRFCENNNDYLLSFYKATGDFSNIILVVVNLDPYHVQNGWIQLPLAEMGIEPDRPYLANDLLTDDKYIWQGPASYVELDPQKSPAHILQIRRHMHREQDFDYFM